MIMLLIFLQIYPKEKEKLKPYFLLPLVITGQSVDTKTLSINLDFLEAINGYSNVRLPNIFLIFFPGSPRLLARPIINATIIIILILFDYINFLLMSSKMNDFLNNWSLFPIAECLGY